MKSEHRNIVFTEDMIREGKLEGLLDSGWELVSMVPYVMQPRDGQTYVREYWITLRRPVDK